MNTEDSKMITAKEYAKMHNVHYTIIRNWLRRDLVPGAIEELSDQYAKFVIHQQAADSNDWRLTYMAHSAVESPVEALRRASQTDDEVKDEFRAQLFPKMDGPRRASKKSAKKGVRAK
jgi:hypothetical protein